MKRFSTKKTLRELSFLSLSGTKIGFALIPPLLQRELRTLWTQFQRETTLQKLKILLRILQMVQLLFQREPLLTLQREVPPPDQGDGTTKPNTISTWLVVIAGRRSEPTVCRPLLSKD
jgi:hypothetical protein